MSAFLGAFRSRFSRWCERRASDRHLGQLDFIQTKRKAQRWQ